MQLLSIIIPVYNEENYVREVLINVVKAALPLNWEKEIILVDDGSADRSREIIERCILEHRDTSIQLVCQEGNQGKGAAINTGFKIAKGDFILIQDADFEYDPNEYKKLLSPIDRGFADVVYGSRFVGNDPHRILYFYHYLGNRFLTFLSNILTNLNLSDMEVGYKIFRREYLNQIKLKERGFGVEPELTAKLSRIADVRIYEVGISYFGRSYAEGKKINWKDGVYAIYCVLKYNIWAKH